MARVSTLYADRRGQTLDEPGLEAAGRSWDMAVVIPAAEFIPLPAGATLVQLPGRAPMGFDRVAKDFLSLESDYPEEAVVGVAAMLPQGYTRTHLPAFVPREDVDVPTLPLFGYAAVGWRGGFVCAAIRTDEPQKWSPPNFNTPDLKGRVERFLNEFPENRLVRHLAHCATDYGCFTAQNLFYRRWEAGIPVSPHCNAACVGCISLQESECCPSPQSRLDFTPTVDEVVALAVPHLSRAEDAIVSFGQGCEGDPTLAGEVLAESIAMIREGTRRGTINVNTNAGNTKAVKRLIDAGLDSMRVSLISANPDYYQAYHRPRGYDLGDVVKSIKCAKQARLFVSLNLLTFPGLTDRPEELGRLAELVRETGVDMIQLRNLNLDPDVLCELLPPPQQEPLGMRRFLDRLRAEVPGLQIGNYSRAVGARPAR